MRKYVLLALLIALPTFAADFELRFAVNPPRYLKQIPLGVITERQVLDQMGVPQSKIEIDGEVRWQYQRVDQDNSATFSYTYVLVDGLVIDVIYNATGCVFGKCAYNGDSARKAQGR